MGNVIAFFLGAGCGAIIIAFLVACSDNNRINEAYMEGFLEGQKEKRGKEVNDIFREAEKR